MPVLFNYLAGVPGFEPGLSVLETDVLTVDTIPLRLLPISSCQFIDVGPHNRQLAIRLLRLFVTSVLAAEAAELAEFQPLGRLLLVLGRAVIAPLTFRARQGNDVSHGRRPCFSCGGGLNPHPAI